MPRLSLLEPDLAEQILILTFLRVPKRLMIIIILSQKLAHPFLHSITNKIIPMFSILQ